MSVQFMMVDIIIARASTSADREEANEADANSEASLVCDVVSVSSDEFWTIESTSDIEFFHEPPD